MNISKFIPNIPIKYDNDKNELLITLPKDLKIKFINNIDIITENEFNLLSLNEINICSMDHNIHFDSMNAAIHLNSRRCKQIKEIFKIIDININSNNNYINKRKSLLLELNNILNNV